MADSTPGRGSQVQEGAVPFGDWLGYLREELDFVAGNELAPREAAFAQAITDSLELPALQNSLHVLHNVDPSRGGPPSYRLLRTAVGATALTHPIPGRMYPHDYPDPSDIADLLQWIYADPALTDELNLSLRDDANHTSMPQRYVARLIAAMALGHTVPNPHPTELDVGCSLQYGNIQTLSRWDNPFEGLQVVVRSSNGKLEVHPEKTTLLNETLRRPDLVVPNQILGIDKVDVSKVKPERIQASLTLDEIVKGEMFETYRRLAATNLRPGSLSFMIADIASKEDMQRVLDARGGRRFEVVSEVAALHSYGSSHLKTAMKRIKSVMSEGGSYALFADFLNLLQDERGNRFPGPMPSWRPGMNILVYSKAVDPRLRAIGRLTTGRAKAIEFYEDFGNVAEGSPLFEDIAKELSS